MHNHCLTKRVSALKPGDRIRVGVERGAWVGGKHLYLPDTRGAEVVENLPDKVRCVDEAGVPFDIRMEYGTPAYCGRGTAPYWTAPLPAGEPGQVKAWCDTLLAHGRKALLLHVGSVEGGRFTATLVAQPQDRVDLPEYDPDYDWAAWKGERVGNADFWDAPLTVLTPSPSGPTPSVLAADLSPQVTPEPGDLLLARGFSCRLEGAEMLTEVEGLVRIGYFPSREAVGAFLPDGPGDHEPSARGPANHADHLEAQDEARVRLEPDEALVLWYETADGARACRFVTMRGMAFRHADAVEDMFYGHEEPPGLYVFEKAKWQVSYSFENEADVDLEGDWTPATPGDLERFGFANLEDLDAVILGTVEAEEGAESEHTALRYMEMAASPPAPLPA